MPKRVFVVDNDYMVSALFEQQGYELVRTPEVCDLAVFTGGEDVTPNLYGDKAHHATFNNPMRDAKEKNVFDYLYAKGIPMVGICRGGQFLNVMSGGRMYQHVSDHTRSHNIIDQRTGETIYVSSTHHQMMMPHESAEVIAVSNLGGTREWYDMEVFRRDQSNTDYEVVLYKDTKCLCFQPHPEYIRPEFLGMREYFFKLLKEFFNV